MVSILPRDRNASLNYQSSKLIKKSYAWINIYTTSVHFSYENPNNFFTWPFQKKKGWENREHCLHSIEEDSVTG